MGMVKAQRFPISVHVHDEELVATAPGKPELALVGGPAERVGIEPEWSAEEGS
jgi:hypothetical protein